MTAPMAKISLSSTSACCQNMTIRTRLAPFSNAHKLRQPAPRAVHTLCRTTSPWSASIPAASQQLIRCSGPLGSRAVASFSTSARRDEAAPASTQTQQQQQQQPSITWDEFLKLRRRRRYVNLVASVGTAAASVAVAVPLAMQYELEDRIAQITGMDPFIAFGLMITAVGGFGWLMGPFVGNAGFLIWNRSIRGEIAKREREFYKHIIARRADPVNSSVSNPVPDYYGEKIGSLSDYKRWLRDQHAFKRKKNKNIV